MFSSHLWDAIAFFDQIHQYIEVPSPEDLEFRNTIQRIVLEFVKSFGSRVTPDDWLKYPNSIALISANLTLVDSYHKTKCKFWAAHGLTDYAWVSWRKTFDWRAEITFWFNYHGFRLILTQDFDGLFNMLGITKKKKQNTREVWLTFPSVYCYFVYILNLWC